MVWLNFQALAIRSPANEMDGENNVGWSVSLNFKVKIENWRTQLRADYFPGCRNQKRKEGKGRTRLEISSPLSVAPARLTVRGKWNTEDLGLIAGQSISNLDEECLARLCTSYVRGDLNEERFTSEHNEFYGNPIASQNAQVNRDLWFYIPRRVHALCHFQILSARGRISIFEAVDIQYVEVRSRALPFAPLLVQMRCTWQLFFSLVFH
jgi:hypothetical protein